MEIDREVVLLTAGFQRAGFQRADVLGVTSTSGDVENRTMLGSKPSASLGLLAKSALLSRMIGAVFDRPLDIIRGVVRLGDVCTPDSGKETPADIVKV